MFVQLSKAIKIQFPYLDIWVPVKTGDSGFSDSGFIYAQKNSKDAGFSYIGELHGLCNQTEAKLPGFKGSSDFQAHNSALFSALLLGGRGLQLPELTTALKDTQQQSSSELQSWTRKMFRRTVLQFSSIFSEVQNPLDLILNLHFTKYTQIFCSY